MRISANNPEHRLRYVVTIDGQNIMDTCFEADDTEGWADCFKLNDDGRKYAVVNANGEHVPATERLHGDVVIRDTWTVKDNAEILEETHAGT